MGNVFITLGLVVVFGWLTVVLLNYAINKYENQRLGELTKQIKQKNSAQILSRSNAIRSFTSFDLNSSIQRSTDFAKHIYNKTLSTIKNVSAGGDEQVSDTKNNIVKNAQNTFISLFKNLSTIVKKTPSTTSTAPEEDQNNIDDVNSKISNEDNIPNKNQYTKDVDGLIDRTLKIDESELNINVNTGVVSGIVSEGGSSIAATIDLNDSTESKKVEEMSIFEKLELRILKQLKESSMANYDIWLQLGDLYLKYDKQDKAKDVYALVLKHATKDNERMKARNGLIALG